MNRQRREGYCVTERAAGLADLLFNIVIHLDCGESPQSLADDVANISKAMRG